MSFKVYSRLSRKVIGTIGSLVIIDVQGQYEASGYTVNDSAAPSANVLYSSQKVDTELDTKADLSVPAAAGNLASIDAAGQYQDSGLKLDDSAAPSANVLYSSLKLLTKSYVEGQFSVQVVPDNVSNIQLNATTNTDIYSEFAANVFTATRNGYYVISAGLLLQPETIIGNGYVQMAIQGPVYYFFDRCVIVGPVTVADGYQMTVSATLQLTTGQTVQFKVWNYSGAARTVLPYASRFTIAQI